ncbi:toll/interleukin-1 receptor domain-containing protein [Allobranchiibius sp. GilTou38]|uniref:toll/interleukin-1 receptor domain-containing protein n=1 Tax=Allobranchiibius sp. GilTou38 TaxID=2815210 RepID=UPI001AA121DE|nr:toll/interleukin-1 receptor domain-containing protein [Allobranchiibius sp. GilTou38]MBO1765450.1 toll/interleukin-1 receptor domain-containing protein [Allobranchiibius sp. GilTou38]
MDEPQSYTRTPGEDVIAPAMQAIMGASDTRPSDGLASPQVFVSWAHANEDWDATESGEWQRQVIEFTTQLRQLGIDADVDLYHLNDDDVDWTRFGPSSVEKCDYVIVVVSRGWSERWTGTNSPTLGAGAAAEADVMHGEFSANQQAWQRKIKLVVLQGAEGADIPPGLQRVSRFNVDPSDPDSFEDLIRTLTGQPVHLKPEMGQIPVLPAKTVDYLRSSRTRARKDNSQQRLLELRLENLQRRLEAAVRTSKDVGPLRQEQAAVQGMLDALSQWSADG